MANPRSMAQVKSVHVDPSCLDVDLDVGDGGGERRRALERHVDAENEICSFSSPYIASCATSASGDAAALTAP